MRLLQIIAVARSRSTAIGRGFGQSNGPNDPRLFVNEPFHWQARSPEEGFSLLWDAIEPALERAGDKQLTVVTKNMALYTSPEAYDRMSAMAIGSLFVIRDPRIQIGSLLERGINDSQVGAGAAEFGQSDVPQYFGRLSEVYRSGPDFRMAWGQMADLYDRRSPTEKAAVMDGDVAARHPEAVLRDACQRLELNYHSGMARGWQPGKYVNIGGAGNSKEPEQNAWTSSALLSQGLGVLVSRPQLDLREAPQDLRDYVHNEAMPVYDRMLQDAWLPPE